MFFSKVEELFGASGPRGFSAAPASASAPEWGGDLRVEEQHKTIQTNKRYKIINVLCYRLM